MKSSDLLTEHEFKKKIVKWLLKYDISFFREPGYYLDDYADLYTLPEFDYVHSDSFIDDDENIITYLKSELHLRATHSRDFREHKLIFFHIIKTFIDSPEVEPYPLGYIIIRYENMK